MTAFNSLIGHQNAIALLLAAVEKNRIAPAYLFVGTAGIGKRLAAKAFGKLILTRKSTSPQQVEKRIDTGNHPDFLWVEPTYQHKGDLISASVAKASGVERKTAPQVRIEQVREISQFLSRPPLEASRSIVVIEAAQTMAEAAANALLKTLEEPGRATLILLAPGVDNLLPTLVSRCQRISFYPLSMAEMEQVLRQNGRGEICDRPTILELAKGSPGEAIAAYDQLQSIPEDLLSQLDRLPHMAQSSSPRTLRQVLELAAEIARLLEVPTQLWLIDYLQHRYWQAILEGEIATPALSTLEQARKALLSYAQPRLVWEVAFLAMMK